MRWSGWLGQSGAEEVAQLYARRWQIELVLKELESHCRLDELPTRKTPVVEALVLLSIITLLVSHCLLNAVRSRLPRLRHRIPRGRRASLFAAVSRPSSTCSSCLRERPPRSQDDSNT